MSKPNHLPALADPLYFGGLAGSSRCMRELFDVLGRIAPTPTTVLIEGETGTGKELCARAIHDTSDRSAGPFAVCDLAGLHRTLVEGELFGHVKGAFTGAVSERAGAFETANTGTLFLDEIGELDLDLQPRLLRAIEDRSVRRVGSNQYRKIDVRIIAATNRDLGREVDQGKFRRDLFHRLAVVVVRIPPLRERKEDIPQLVEGFVAEAGVQLSMEATFALQAHDWPGNVRELKNVIERGRSLTVPGGVITPAELGLPQGLSVLSSFKSTPSMPVPESYHQMKKLLLESWERQFVTDALRRSEGNVSEAARKSGVGRAHLHRLLRKYQIH